MSQPASAWTKPFAGKAVEYLKQTHLLDKISCLWERI